MISIAPAYLFDQEAFPIQGKRSDGVEMRKQLELFSLSRALLYSGQESRLLFARKKKALSDSSRLKARLI